MAKGISKRSEIDINAIDFNFDINLDIDIDIDEQEEKNHHSHFIVTCVNDVQDDFIRKFFNLGVKTKSERGKYETNIIEAEKVIQLILELWQKEE